MSLSLESLAKNIIDVLNRTEDIRKVSGIQMSSTSNVSENNRYRTLLKDIRSDLLNFDPQKKERIIYTIQTVLSENLKNDSEIIAVFKRILEVVQHYNLYGTVLVSPKKQANNISVKASVNSGTIKQLFPVIEEQINKTNN
ncbi:hypothetical protein [Candidatus Neptunochlamydia vexilliferae]|uniref:Uncharacterized protein n=1 Tax=Candidatus Neptunichlamydia vexilliferae TaxID=1651774 RepID=A0ABS0B326_9BACT|nr:hypothetical protein [Candidatus Neptunochlamydia vexilliferae]MBF5060292.1 hypothetical protein [Candidatus Neptunochlamydia vexilliferae]